MKRYSLFFIFSLLIIHSQYLFCQPNITLIDDFENRITGAKLSEFSMKGSAAATVDYTVSTNKFNGSKCARMFVQSAIEGKWINNSYSVPYLQSNWSGKSGFRVKIQTDRHIQLSITFTDKTNELWGLNPNNAIIFVKTGNDREYKYNASKGGTGIELSKGFEGEILIPFSSLAIADWYTGTRNNIFDVSEIKSIGFGFSSTASANTSLYIDDISVYTTSPIVTTIDLCGIEKAYIPISGNDYVQLSSTLRNSAGLPLENADLNWEITPANQGVSIDNNGLLTINKDAITSEYNIKASLVDNPATYGEHKLRIAPKSSYIHNIYTRLNNREFPSLHMAWNGIDDGSVVRNSMDDKAKHDLYWHNIANYGLIWQKQNGYDGFANSFTNNSITNAKVQREVLLQKNPNLLLFCCLSWIEQNLTYLPDTSEWWLRDGNGNKIKGWGEGNYQSYLLDTSNESYQSLVAAKAKAMAECGVFDGIMIDCWKDTPDYVKLLQKIRALVGNEIMIIVNSNMYEIPNSAKYVNGIYMESYKASTDADWRLIENTLVWAEKNLRMPRVNCLETWAEVSRTSTSDQKKMRATTALALTQSNGFCIFTDDNKLPSGDHLHNFYDFWVKRLGKSISEGTKRTDGVWQRIFEKGISVYNPIGNQAVTVTFDSPHRSIATGETGLSHVVPSCDGDIFIKSDETQLSFPVSKTNIEIYPSVVKDFLNIRNNSGSDFQFEIYSSCGILFNKGTINCSTRFDVSENPTGLYIMKFKSDLPNIHKTFRYFQI